MLDRGWSVVQDSAGDVGMLPLDAPLPIEFLEACLMVGRYSQQLILDEWPRFRADRIEKGGRSTKLGFLAAFRDRWLDQAKRFATTRADLEAIEDRDQRRLAAVRIRESEYRARLRREAQEQAGGPDAATEAALRALCERFEAECPDARPAPLPAHAGMPWTPPDPAKRAAIEAELAEEMRKAGGLQ